MIQKRKGIPQMSRNKFSERRFRRYNPFLVNMVTQITFSVVAAGIFFGIIVLFSDLGTLVWVATVIACAVLVFFILGFWQYRLISCRLSLKAVDKLFPSRHVFVGLASFFGLLVILAGEFSQRPDGLVAGELKQQYSAVTNTFDAFWAKNEVEVTEDIEIPGYALDKKRISVDTRTHTDGDEYKYALSTFVALDPSPFRHLAWDEFRKFRFGPPMHGDQLEWYDRMLAKNEKPQNGSNGKRFKSTPTQTLVKKRKLQQSTESDSEYVSTTIDALVSPSNSEPPEVILYNFNARSLPKDLRTGGGR